MMYDSNDHDSDLERGENVLMLDCVHSADTPHASQFSGS